VKFGRLKATPTFERNSTGSLAAIRYIAKNGWLIVSSTEWLRAGAGGAASRLRRAELTLDTDAVNLDANQPAGGSSGQPAASGGGTTGAEPSVGTPSPTGGKGGSPAGGATGTGTAGSSTGGKAGASAGGAAGVGTAGVGNASSTPTGGSAQGGASGVPTDLYSSCLDYCSASSRGVCPNPISIDECVTSCASELSGQSPACQYTAVSLLGCLTTVYQNSTGCTELEQLSVAKCGNLSDAYQSCAGTAAVPTPTPAPTCASSGSSDNGKCSVNLKCDNGAYYTVYCYQTNTDQSSCTCNTTAANGSGSGAVLTLNESVVFACYDSLAACGFPQLGLK